MKDVAEALASLDDALASLVSGAFPTDVLRSASDDDLLRVLGLAARIERRAQALLVEAATHVEQRSQDPATSERMTTRYGCRSAGELLQRVTLGSARRAAEVLKAARAVSQSVAPSSGELLPAEFAAMRDALACGAVGVEGLLAVTGPLAHVVTTAGRAAHGMADEELAAAASGADGGPAPTADELRTMATVWAMHLDPDGAEPREAAALRKRGLTLGPCSDGLVPLRGALLPEVAGQLQLVFDSILNPKVDEPAGPRFTDDSEAVADALAERRTRTQRQHDAFATALSKIAASGALPTVGGAAPTLVVSVRAEDLASGRGFAHVPRVDEPVTLAAARHVACAGGIQRVVFGDGGRIVALGTPERVFTHHQRRAIALRDGGCVIPGCRVPAEWCEIHHVHEHALGGATHTDNGVLLCWFHHRTLESSGWRVRMSAGVPEVRGPYWWDASMTWRRVTTSAARQRERVIRRQ